MFYDPTIILLIPAIALAMYAQAKVQSTYQKYARVAAKGGYTGAQVARMILDEHGLGNIAIELISGELTDHYDPRVKKLRLSGNIYHGRSLASLGIAAHEVGHALQHATGYMPLHIRNNFVPVAQFGSNLSFPLLILGLIMGLPSLVKAGVILFSAVVIFQLVTLPVEFNASHRAMNILASSGYIDRYELRGTKKVLDAAALTYVAAALMAALNLLRLLLISGLLGRRK